MFSILYKGLFMKTFTKKLTLLTTMAFAISSTTLPVDSNSFTTLLQKSTKSIKADHLVYAVCAGIFSFAAYSIWKQLSQPTPKDLIKTVSIQQIAEAIIAINTEFESKKSENTDNEDTNTQDASTENPEQIIFQEILTQEAQNLSLIELVIFATKSADHAQVALKEINRIIAYQEKIAKESDFFGKKHSKTNNYYYYNTCNNNSFNTKQTAQPTQPAQAPKVEVKAPQFDYAKLLSNHHENDYR